MFTEGGRRTIERKIETIHAYKEKKKATLYQEFSFERKNTQPEVSGYSR